MIKKWQRYLKIKMQKKVKQENDIPVKVIKENIEIFSSVLSRMQECSTLISTKHLF